MLPTPPGPNADCNLLFGILALQMDFIGRDALIAAMHAWVLDKSRPLGDILAARGDLDAEAHALLAALVRKHLARHGDNPAASLAAVSPIGPLRDELGRVADTDVQASLATVSWGRSADDPDATGSLRVGTSSSSGHRFRVLRPHAKGALGRVWVAMDEELHREVALKEIQDQHADQPDSRARFLLEAEVTGGLEHPGVVPVYGLGTYDDGRPFYAMRFIRGESLLEAIRRFHDPGGRDVGDPARWFESLDFRRLLGRFVDVCNAVAYAHSRGVLHRDLKPGNIMLGKFGETLVVDWGLAKPRGQAGGVGTATEGPLRPVAAGGSSATAAGSAVGTPAYMSPEQAEGRLDELGPASDVYSLGATLYEVLSGRRAFAGGVEDVLTRVRRGDFPPPRQVRPDVPRALEAVCLKSMAGRPEDRYPSALALAADVEHWLADEPVAAYAEPWAARAGRAARRHKTALTGAAAFLVSAVVALAASTGLVLAEQRETERQRQVAVRNYAMSRKQCFDIIRLIETTEPELASVPALHERRKELLTTASEACRQFREQEPDDPYLQARAAQIYRFTANFYRLTNETRSAERFYRDSISAREGLVRMFPDEPDQQLLLADTVRHYASLQLRQGRLQEATENLNRSLEVAERLLLGNDRHPAYRRGVALALVNLGSVQRRQGKHERSGETVEILKRSERLFRKLVEGNLEDRLPYDPLMLAATLNQEAMVARDLGKLDAAEATHKEAVLLLRGMLDKNKKTKVVNDADVQHFEAECRVEQAKTWAKAAKPNYLANADKLLEAAVTNLGLLARDYPNNPTYEEALAEAYQVRGEVREQAKDFEKARDAFDRSQKMLKRLSDRYPDLTELRGKLGKSYAGLGRAARALGHDDSADWPKRAAAELRTAAAQSPTEVAWKRALDDVLNAGP